jgi:hypothetical protein
MYLAAEADGDDDVIIDVDADEDDGVVVAKIVDVAVVGSPRTLD